MTSLNGKIVVPHSTRSYPEGDFIHEAYDRNYDAQITNILLVLSTPRSGSTYLCEELYNRTGALGHEYFQPHGYIQCLARRWGALTEDGIIDAKYFNKKLIQHRACNGTLIINLHGSHIGLFLKFLPFFPSVRVEAIHLIRSGLIDQAISYALASKTKEWSSAYACVDKEKVLDLSDDDINSKIEIINQQTAMIGSFLACYKVPCLPILYENIKNEFPRIAQFLNIKFKDLKKSNLSTRVAKQSNRLSDYAKTSYAIRKLGLSVSND